ncbi:hypothetical protein M9Y10_016919 [Tritrichomonas musculus]|uniref:Protein kinase domain-containing protein n=1 Tax=Tritrichomonas musculus TaxID=1915356 RepID=A0ABR2HXL1_9EUKA
MTFILQKIIKKSQISTIDYGRKIRLNCPQIINKYEKSDFIDICNIKSNVQICFNIKDQLLYIFKIYNMNDEESELLYERELTIYQNIENKSPFISKFFGTFDKSPLKYLVLQYIEGETLETFITTTENISHFDKIKIILEIIIGIEYIHYRGIVLRDIKYDNIIIDSNNDAFLIDFDSIKTNESTSMTCFLGNLIFASPEQYYEKIYSFKSDAYSVGMIIHFILTEKKLDDIITDDFRDRIFASKQNILSFKEIPSLSEEYQYLKDLYQKCLSFCPDSRPTMNQLFKNIIQAANNRFNDEQVKIIDNLIEMHNKQLLNIDSEFLLNAGILFEDEEKYEKAKYYYELSSELNNSESLIKLGYLYKNGFGVQKDCKKAIKYYELAANLNNSEAFFILGELYEKGDDVKKDFLKAKEYYELSSRLNNSESLIKLGKLYENGYGVDRDFLEAKKYYEMGVKLNNSDALLYLGDLYAEGHGVHRNFNKAKELYEKAGEMNKSKSLIHLGDLYKMSYKPHQNIIQSIECYTKAYELYNDSEGLIKLGVHFYHSKRNDEHDERKGFKYFKLAAKQNNSDAFYHIGYHYKLRGGTTIAIYYFEKAAKYNNSDAYAELGRIYENLDYVKARKYYEKAAHLNNLDGLIGLINLYAEGLGVEKDHFKLKEYIEEAFKLDDGESINFIFRLYLNEFSVEQGFLKTLDVMIKWCNNHINYYFDLRKTEEMLIEEIIGFILYKHEYEDPYFYIGYLFEKGGYIKQNYSKAKMYYIKSSESNNSDSLLHLGYLYYKGAGVPQNFLQAKHYFKLAAKQDNSFGYLNLGYLYYQGYGVEQNFSKALKYFELALSNDIKFACIYLGFLYLNGYGVPKDPIIAQEYFSLIEDGDMYIALKTNEIFLNGNDAEIELESLVENFLDIENSYYGDLENTYEAFLILGNIYFYGLNVPKDYIKAKQYYEHSAISYKMRHFHLFGSAVSCNVDNLKDFYELTAIKPDVSPFLNLGFLYQNGYGVDKSYLKAKKYYELAAEENNSFAFYFLGYFYKKGYDVKQDYLKVKAYYELSAEYGNSEAYLKLGNLYKKGIGVKQNYYKAIKCYKLAADLDNSDACYYLGELYSTGYFVEKNIQKSMSYFLKSIEINNEEKSIDLYHNFDLNRCKFKYQSYNDLGLIFITLYQNVEEAYKYISVSGFVEYPYGKNNLGLLYQYYLNNPVNAQYMYEEAAKYSFCLAEYNLGHMKEKDGNMKESIEFYKRASKHEKEPLIFRNHHYGSMRLDISKKFIICFTNLKLTHYYFSNAQYKKAKKYFVKMVINLNISDVDNQYHFHFHFDKRRKKNLFSYIKYFIINFPLFDLKNQININLNVFDVKDVECHTYNINKSVSKLNETHNKDNNNKEKLKEKSNDLLKLKENSLIVEDTSNTMEQEMIFEDPGELFDYFIQIEDLKIAFNDEIKEIIEIFNQILYQPPYHILFGQINIENLNRNKIIELRLTNINEKFYEALNLAEFQQDLNSKME